MDELQKNIPRRRGVPHCVRPHTVRARVHQVRIQTLLEAIALVVLVVILFLQTWRASIIPLLAVPVSVVGTFAVLHLLGFSINTLSLFGLVLAIGIVVDDAIVVVENVERNIEEGLTPREATYRAMREVSGPIIAIALVLVRGVRAAGLHQRPHRPVLQAVRGHHRHLHGDLGHQLADAVAGAGRRCCFAFPGLNPLQFTNTPNSGVVFFTLKPFNERKRSAAQITAELNQKFAVDPGRLHLRLHAAADPGAGQRLGLGRCSSKTVRGLGYGELQGAVQAFQGAVSQDAGHGFPISSYQANVPQLDVEVDRVKAKAQGVPLTELFDTLQTYLGSAYVNDFNMFGRTWQVIAQADGRSATAWRTSPTCAPATPRRDGADRQHGDGQADLRPGPGDALQRLSGRRPLRRSRPARAVVRPRRWPRSPSCRRRCCRPAWHRVERPELPAGDPGQGGAGGVPAGRAAGLPGAGRAVRELDAAAGGDPDRADDAAVGAVRRVALGGDNNVFVQVGLVVLMGLACKNAILIVEFARELELQGKGIVEAALEACRLRLRPIVMTSVAFIAGTVPLVLSPAPVRKCARSPASRCSPACSA
jgi:multidrug efflux pump subunit AcrB